jgi:2-polyprenyl-3-methyl-5-hydroxy-6-metoxy-1,4-benzoquinol methylase
MIKNIENTNCTICGVETTEILAKELRRGEGQVLYCTDCDYGFLAENHIQDSKAYYATEYRKKYAHKAEVSPTSPQEIFAIYSQFQENRMPFIRPKLNHKTKLLEVGASAGQFLKHILNDVAIAHAIELDSECCNFLRDEIGVEASSEFLEKSPFADERYDIVCAFQVMEHVENPIHFLKSLKKVTAPGGLIFLEVPNLHDSLLSVWDIPSHNKFFYHSAHLHYFTEKSLINITAKAGFSNENTIVNFTQDYNLLNHLHWIMNDGPQENCLVGMSEISLKGKDVHLSDWLSREMKLLNEQYIERLVLNKKTSNILLTLYND